MSEHDAPGNFTMVYDEGFEVRFSDYTFFAFSKFNLPPGGDEKKSVSKCSETQVGWYKTSENQYGCYHAQKKTSSSGVALVEEATTTMVEEQRQLLEHPVDKADDDTILTPAVLLQRANALNAKHSTWRARAYSRRYAGLRRADFNRKAGLRYEKNRRLGSSSTSMSVLKQKNAHHQWSKDPQHRHMFLQMLNEECASENAKARARKSKFLAAKKGDMRVLDNLITATTMEDLEDVEANLRPCESYFYGLIFGGWLSGFRWTLFWSNGEFRTFSLTFPSSSTSYLNSRRPALHHA